MLTEMGSSDFVEHISGSVPVRSTVYSLVIRSISNFTKVGLRYYSSISVREIIDRGQNVSAVRGLSPSDRNGGKHLYQLLRIATFCWTSVVRLRPLGLRRMR
jgi:hypothetical protein